MLIGTEGGIIEHWSIEDQTIMTVYEAHLGSSKGISSIIELKTQSDLLWSTYPQEKRTPDLCKLIATAALDTPEFRIWILDMEV